MKEDKSLSDFDDLFPGVRPQGGEWYFYPKRDGKKWYFKTEIEACVFSYLYFNKNVI